jgi:hypothetical protein
LEDEPLEENEESQDVADVSNRSEIAKISFDDISNHHSKYITNEKEKSS